jgi:hypothetical protein
MEIVFVYTSPGGISGQVHNSETPGCYTLRCGIAGLVNSNFCLSDVLNDFNNDWGLVFNSPTLSGCEVVVQNLYQLITWESQIKDMFPKFEETELDKLIQKYKDDKRARCADVYFCKNDFRVLSPPNLLDLVSCNDYPGWTHDVLETNGSFITEPVDCSEGINENGPLSNNQGCNVFYCLDPNSSSIIRPANSGLEGSIEVRGKYVYICPTFKGHFLLDEHLEARSTIKSGPIHSKEVLIYPNPNEGIFEVLLQPENAGIITIEAFNIVGTKVFRESIYVDETLESTKKIDLTNCPSGIFFLNIADSKGNSCVKKVVKN